MAVPARYILAALAFAVAALGLFLLPVDAHAQCNGCNRSPPPCQSNCAPPAPPPCANCRPNIIVPPPHVPPPNIVVVNAGARASAQASAMAIAVANVEGGDTIIRNNSVVMGGGGAAAAAQSAAFSVVERSMEMERRTVERALLIEAICLDERGNPHPASQTFGERDVHDGYSGEIFRCMAGTRMRWTMDGRSYDCEPGQALWYENGRAQCRQQIARRPCNERSLLRRYGPGQKMVRIREEESREAVREAVFSGSMSMDGGVGQSVW